MASSVVDINSEIKFELKRRELARRRLEQFTTFTKTDYRVNWHHGYVASKLDDFIHGRTKRLIILMPPQHGKALEVSTPVLTTNDWIPHGSLDPGDRVYDNEGKPRLITSVTGHYYANSIRLSFSNGEQIVAANEHEWNVYTKDGPLERIETKDIAKKLKQTRVWIKAAKSTGRDVEIVKLEFVGARLVNCIEVEGGVYLAGDAMIQTHNSELSTRRAPAKILGDYPTQRVAVCAYNHSFASKFNRDVQRIIMSPEYQLLYPETQLYGKNIRSTAEGAWLRNSDEFEIVGKGGSLISVGVKGGLTGNKIDKLFIDDPFKGPEDAFSSVNRKNVIDWYDSVCETRLDNDAGICIVNTSWHSEDLTQTIIKRWQEGKEPYDWEVIKIQAIRDGESVVEDPREDGEALWEERHSAHRMKAVEKKSPRIFAALYQQEPIDEHGGMFDFDWIQGHRVDDHPPLDVIVVGLDPAVTSGVKSDETGIVCVGKSAAGHYFVLEDRSNRLTPVGWAKAGVNMLHERFANFIVGEVNQGGDLVESEIHHADPKVKVVKVRASQGKVARAEPIARLYEMGLVHHVGTFAKLENQLTKWEPGQKSPDRMEALVWAITYLEGSGKRRVIGQWQ